MGTSGGERHEGEEDCVMCAQLRWEGSGPVDFVVAPGAGGGWHHWAASLTRLLRRIGQEPTRAVIISQDRVTQRYVQLLIGHGKAQVEASSNVYLLGEHRLSADHDELLADIGWIAPTSDVDEPDELPANWTLPMVVGDWDTLMEVLLATIAGVFGFDEHVPVEVRSFPADHPCRECFPEVAA